MLLCNGLKTQFASCTHLPKKVCPETFQLEKYMYILNLLLMGLRNKEKRNDVLNYLGGLQAALIHLQDTHWIDSDIRVIKQVWNGDLY